MNDTRPIGFLRIGELSRRTGVSPELLRAWERRYDVLQPTRSDGGFRLYSTADEQRVSRMKRLIEQGVAASQAARLATSGPPEEEGPATTTPLPEGLSLSLRSALDAFDEPEAERVLDRLFSAFPLEQVMEDVVLPYLRELGERWERGEVSIQQEHFASNLIRGRLLALGRGWGSGEGRLAVLACLPGERHELGLISLGIALRNRGWRITYLGADTPMDSLKAAADSLSPEVVIVVGTQPSGFELASGDLRELAAKRSVAIAGRGAQAALADSVGARLLDASPVGSAALL